MLDEVVRIADARSTDIGEFAVHTALTRDANGYLDFLKTELLAIARGETVLELPPKQLFTDAGGGDFRVMPCVTRGPRGTVKTVKVIGTNLAQRVVPDQITVGKALALHPEENHVTHVFDACLLSSARTGACAALAVELLAPRPGALAIVGAGRVGYYAALFVLARGGVSQLTIADLYRERADRLAALLSRDFPGCRVAAANPDALGAADVRILATTSRSPVCRPPAGNTRLVVSLGADIDCQRELDDAWPACADLFVDTADSVRYGDLKAWLTEGRIDAGRLRDFFSLLQEGVGGNRPRVFISTGSALFDNLTIAYLLRNGLA